MHPPEALEGDRLILRRSRVEDAPAIHHAYATDPEVTRYLIWRPHRDLTETEEFLAGSRRSWDDGVVHGWQIWCEGEIVGGFAFRPENAKRGSIGFALARTHWGRGLVPEAIGVVRNWAFKEAGFRRLWAVCDVDNAASARAMEKAGMRLEGTLRRWIVHPNLSDEPRDCLCYAATR